MTHKNNTENVRLWRQKNTEKNKENNRKCQNRKYHWTKITKTLGEIDPTLFN